MKYIAFFTVIFSSAAIAQESPSLPNQNTISPTSESILSSYGLSHLPYSDKVKVDKLMNDIFALNSSQSGSCPTSGTVESKIDGEFNGWEGETVYKLANGQVWQQSRYKYKYKYKYSPDVLIFKDGSRWKIKVEGMDELIEVKCIN